MVSVLHVNAAAFIRCVRVIGPFVTGEALQHLFHLGVFVGVMAIFAPCRVFRLNMVPVIEVFDDSPLGMLSPLIALFRIA